MLLDVLAQRLEECGLRVEARESCSPDSEHDADVTLTRGQARQAYAMSLTQRATLSGLRAQHPQDATRPTLIGAEAVSPRSAEALRRAGIQYVDAAGNAWISFHDVLIDVRGRRPARGFSPGRQRRPGGNLFSTGRAKVAFVLLQWPALWHRTQREVATAAGVSLGQANGAIAMFRDAGFGPGGHRSDSELLDLWVGAFPTGLSHKIFLAGYHGDLEAGAVGSPWPSTIEGAEISGEMAVPHLLRPTAMTIYVEALDPSLPLKHRWRSDGESNITVRKRFWRVPSWDVTSNGVADEARQTAPSVLIYADLMSSANPRAREAAGEWRSQLAGLRPTDT